MHLLHAANPVEPSRCCARLRPMKPGEAGRLSQRHGITFNLAKVSAATADDLAWPVTAEDPPQDFGLHAASARASRSFFCEDAQTTGTGSSKCQPQLLRAARHMPDDRVDVVVPDPLCNISWLHGAAAT